MAVHAARTKGKMCEQQLISFFQEELASLLSAVKPFSGDLEG